MQRAIPRSNVWGHAWRRLKRRRVRVAARSENEQPVWSSTNTRHRRRHSSGGAAFSGTCDDAQRCSRADEGRRSSTIEEGRSFEFARSQDSRAGFVPNLATVGLCSFEASAASETSQTAGAQRGATAVGADGRHGVAVWRPHDIVPEVRRGRDTASRDGRHGTTWRYADKERMIS